MSKKYKYHISHSYYHKESNEKIHFLTQLYQIGIYGIVNNDPALQGSFSPNKIVQIEKHVKKELEEGNISDLEFGREIIVRKDKDGFWEEVKEEVNNETD